MEHEEVRAFSVIVLKTAVLAARASLAVNKNSRNDFGASGVATAQRVAWVTMKSIHSATTDDKVEDTH
jgi:hypothetical protein